MGWLNDKLAIIWLIINRLELYFFYKGYALPSSWQDLFVSQTTADTRVPRHKNESLLVEQDREDRSRNIWTGSREYSQDTTQIGRRIQEKVLDIKIKIWTKWSEDWNK